MLHPGCPCRPCCLGCCLGCPRPGLATNRPSGCKSLGRMLLRQSPLLPPSQRLTCCACLDCCPCHPCRLGCTCLCRSTQSVCSAALINSVACSAVHPNRRLTNQSLMHANTVFRLLQWSLDLILFRTACREWEALRQDFRDRLPDSPNRYMPILGGPHASTRKPGQASRCNE